MGWRCAQTRGWFNRQGTEGQERRVRTRKKISTTEGEDKPSAAGHQSAGDKKLLRAAGTAGLIMSVSLFASRILGLLRDSVIAGRFGLGSKNDACQLAFLIPDIIFMLIAGGGLSSAFIPVFAEYWHTHRQRQAWKVFSVVVTVCSIAVIVLIAVTWLLAPVLVTWLADPSRQDAIPDAIVMSRIILPAQFAFLVGSILLGTLYARNQFLAPSLAPNVYNLGIILGAAVLPAVLGMGIVAVAWGALIGAFVGNLILPILLMIPQGVHFRPSLDLKTEGVSKFFILLLPVILGFSLPSVVQLITQHFASPYGPGSNVVVKYSNNLMQAPLGIFGQSLALGAFPALSQFFAQKRMDLYRDLVSKTMRTVIYLCVFSAVIMFVMAPLIVNIIYGYGRAGTNEKQLNEIAVFLQIYCVAIPAWCMQPVLMRGFFSLHNTLRPVLIGTAMTGVFIVLCMLVRQNPLGIYALPWASNFAAVTMVVILFFALEKEVGKLDRRGLVVTKLKTVLAAVPAGLVAYGGTLLFNPGRKILSILLFLFLACLSFWVFYYFSRLLKIKESDYLSRLLSKWRRKETPPPAELTSQQSGTFEP